jgi:hypothetical protein
MIVPVFHRHSLMQKMLGQTKWSKKEFMLVRRGENSLPKYRLNDDIPPG